MDILVLLLLAALYIVPELLRRRKPKEYKYPEFPDTPSQRPVPTAPAPVNEEYRWPAAVLDSVPAVSQSAQPNPVYSQPLPSLLPATADEPVVFNQLMYGIVMAEVLGQPKSVSRRSHTLRQR